MITVTVSPGYDFPPGVPIGLDELRAAAKPNITFTGNLTDLSDGSGVPATVTGQTLVWNAVTGKWEPSGTIKVRGADLGPMQGATTSADGIGGAAPQPLKADATKFLRGDGVWATVAGGTAGADLFNYLTFY